jgi:hypothetical protein
MPSAAGNKAPAAPAKPPLKLLAIAKKNPEALLVA